MPKQYKKAYNLKRLKNKWYYTVKPNNAKQLYFPLQTSDKLKALDRAKQDIHPYHQFLLSGAVSKDEVLVKCQWYKLRGKAATAKPTTLKYYLDKWLEIRKVDVRKSTYERNIDTIRAMLKILSPDMPIKEFNLSTIEQFKKARHGNVTLCTLNTDLRTIKCWCSWLVDNEIISLKPKFKIITPDSNPAHYIKHDDFKRLIELGSIPQIHRDLWKLYYTTGMRKSEAIDGTLNCNKLIVAGEDAKGKRQYNISLHPWQIQVVKQLHQLRDEYLERGYDIENFKGNITNVIRNAYKILGIYKKGLTNIHSLRHSFGGRMYLVTGDIRKVKDMMRHRKESTTNQYLDYEVDDLMRDFPADAKHSVFKDNINRVKQANADVLKELDIN